MKLLRLPLTSSCILELKKKKGCPDRNRGEKRSIQEESVRDNDGLVKRQKPEICVHVISAWCTCGWLHPLACVPSH